MRNVVVVGGGVMGSAAAWSLAPYAQVSVLEQFEPGHGRGSSHGSSRIFRLAYPDPFYVELAARALPLWRELEQESGQEILDLTGAVDHGPRERVEPIEAALRAAGRPGEILAPAAAAERWPGLRFDEHVLFHPDAGRVHADRATAAFRQVAAKSGADFRHGVRVASVTPAGHDRVEVVTDGGEVLVADAVVLAVGGWAPDLVARTVPGLPRLRVTQEQPVHFPAADPLSWPSFLHYRGATGSEPGAYGLGSVDGVKVGFHGVGPQIDADRSDRAVDPAALAKVVAYAERWVPGVDTSGAVASTCLYTLTPDHDFVLDRHGAVTVLAGFSGHGFKFAPLIGRLAADLVAGQRLPPRFALGVR
ncbi:FAD-dependent oxidoreductase [Catellatospora sichuanensis]|uniref:FAD-dependent oxidoreductase n=1 Tax=Catellatospora sichuanensis TaxID=1969805 RepID=UPI0011842609|nr:FAD-dependent oxidoreductase [Catellatospora sichuanensis]